MVLIVVAIMKVEVVAGSKNKVGSREPWVLTACVKVGFAWMTGVVKGDWLPISLICLILFCCGWSPWVIIWSFLVIKQRQRLHIQSTHPRIFSWVFQNLRWTIVDFQNLRWFIVGFENLRWIIADFEKSTMIRRRFLENLRKNYDAHAMNRNRNHNRRIAVVVLVIVVGVKPASKDSHWWTAWCLSETEHFRSQGVQGRQSKIPQGCQK